MWPVSRSDHLFGFVVLQRGLAGDLQDSGGALLDRLSLHRPLFVVSRSPSPQGRGLCQWPAQVSMFSHGSPKWPGGLSRSSFAEASGIQLVVIPGPFSFSGLEEAHTA